MDRLLVGKDGNVRSAVVKVLSKGNRPIEIRRPVQKLFPLEVREKAQPKDQQVPQLQMVKDDDVVAIIRRA